MGALGMQYRTLGRSGFKVSAVYQFWEPFSFGGAGHFQHAFRELKTRLD